MSSGVPVDLECLIVFQDLKLKKTLQYIIFTLNKDMDKIVVEKKVSHEQIAEKVKEKKEKEEKEAEEKEEEEPLKSAYDQFLEDLPEDDCRWAVYDFEFEKEGEGKRNKIVFYAWSPDAAKVKAKMVFASSKEALRKSLVGIAVEIQGTAFDEVAYEAILEKVSKGY